MEPFVDLNVLPKLMRTLEAHVYRRGQGYRFGGDEYALLLENTSPDEAANFLERLRKSVEHLQFIGTKAGFRMTVSVGFVLVAPECHLTGLEIESLAARAKHEAKKAGKNRLATYDGPWFDTARILADQAQQPTT